ncbi:zinc transporter ZIP8-like [Scleropages formosus]|uniref:Zinc transporter ZIP8-like n=1 Tax=Scleropages formosus TaxID=113540 RepID=A0A0P7WHT2_SCLFO|nr:zinc transporter ZIP8-like [Scleropages formosus]
MNMGVDSATQQCVSLAEVLSHYGLSNQCQLSMEHLKNICLTILHQGPPPVCPTQAPPPKTLDHHDSLHEIRQQVIAGHQGYLGKVRQLKGTTPFHDTWFRASVLKLLTGTILVGKTSKSTKCCGFASSPAPLNSALRPSAWGYGFLAVSIINLSSLMGLALVPFAAKPCFPKVLSYFTALGIGTLFSNAVLQLIPEVLGFDPGADNYNLSVTGIFGGFYVLFFTEGILKMVLKTEHEVRHHPVAKGRTKGQTRHRQHMSMTHSSDLPRYVCPEGRTRTVCCGWLRSRPLGSVRTVAWMVTLSDALHNFADGLVIGASFVASVLAGFSTSIAVMCEELPHELGDFVILLNAGLSIPQVVFFNILSSLSCYLGLALGILVGGAFAPNAIFGIAGGMFLYVSAVDMFPEMNNIPRCEERTPRSSVLFFLIQNAGLLSGFAVILLITLFAGDISLE